MSTVPSVPDSRLLQRTNTDEIRPRSRCRRAGVVQDLRLFQASAANYHRRRQRTSIFVLRIQWWVGNEKKGDMTDNQTEKQLLHLGNEVEGGVLYMIDTRGSWST